MKKLYVFDEKRYELLKIFINLYSGKVLAIRHTIFFLVDFGTRFILDEFLVFIPKECP